MSEAVAVYVVQGDPTCVAALRYLEQRGVPVIVKDVERDPEAANFLLTKVGRPTVPVFQIGERILVGFDPVQLARFLPGQDDDTEHVSFGAAVRTVSTEVAKAAGLPAPFGVEVGPVKPGSPAAEAGIASGDVISEIGPYSLTGGAEQFQTAVAGRRPGDVMTLTVWHGGDSRTVEVRFPAAEAETAGDGAGDATEGA